MTRGRKMINTLLTIVFAFQIWLPFVVADDVMPYDGAHSVFCGVGNGFVMQWFGDPGTLVNVEVLHFPTGGFKTEEQIEVQGDSIFGIAVDGRAGYEYMLVIWESDHSIRYLSKGCLGPGPTLP